MSGLCKCNCSSSDSTLFIFSCSGAADVGELADRAARRLVKLKSGDMACLAGIGGKISGIIESARSADRTLTIDGCPLDCAKKSLDQEKLKTTVHIRMTDIGFKKGSTEVNDKQIEIAVAEIKRKLGCEGGQ